MSNSLLRFERSFLIKTNRVSKDDHNIWTLMKLDIDPYLVHE